MQTTKTQPENLPEINDNATLLDRVNVPADMRGLTDEELTQLSVELRQATIDAVSKTGGHLGAGLGVVELTTAIHAVFDTPHDRLIWDVGHQCYPHKILTGRKDRIHTLRQKDGLSGFTKRSESEYDPFGAAHSSTSISAGLGMAIARDLQECHPCESRDQIDQSTKQPDSCLRRNDKKREVIAVIGDGSMSAGMAYEAMNNAGHLKSRLIVILNDNEMSIAPPVGALSKYLTRLVSSKKYIGAREAGKKIVDMFPPPLRHAVKRAEESARMAMGTGTLFEEMGFYYIGPIDGHNMEHLLPVLRNVRDSDYEGPILIHAITKKGKGYAPAETAADKMHGVAKFDVVTGTQNKPKSLIPNYTDVFADNLINEAAKDDKIVAITAAMPSGTGLNKFGKEFPDRMFDVGIAEQHAVTFAAGLATEGMKPFCAIYSTFLQRAYDQVVHDVCIQNLPVRFAMDRAGLVGADGQTHAGAFDIAYLACLPNMTLMAAADEAELVHMVHTAAQYNDGPIAFRYPRGKGTGVDLPDTPQVLEIGKGRIVHQSPSLRAERSNPEPQGKTGLPRQASGLPRNDTPNSSSPRHAAGVSTAGIRKSAKHNSVAILSFGARLSECLKAAEILEQKGQSVTVADARFAKPLDTELVTRLAQTHNTLITIEEGARGGFGAIVLEYLANNDLMRDLKVRTLTLPDRFQDQASQEDMYEEAGLVAGDIISTSLRGTR